MSSNELLQRRVAGAGHRHRRSARDPKASRSNETVWSELLWLASLTSYLSLESIFDTHFSRFSIPQFDKAVALLVVIV